MSRSTCIHYSLRMRIVDEMDDSIQQFIDSFDRFIQNVDETKKLFQMEDCKFEENDKPYCEIFHSMFHTFDTHMYNIWDLIKIASTPFSTLKIQFETEKKKQRREEIKSGTGLGEVAEVLKV